MSLFCTGSVEALDDLEAILTAGFQKLWTPNWGYHTLLYAIELSLKELHNGDGKFTPSFDDLCNIVASNEYRQIAEWLIRSRGLEESAGTELYFSTNCHASEAGVVLLHLVGKQLGEVYQLATCEDLHNGQSDVQVYLYGGFCGVEPTKTVWLHSDSASELTYLSDGQPVRGLNHWSAIGPYRHEEVLHLPDLSGLMADGFEHSLFLDDEVRHALLFSPTPALNTDASRKRAASQESEESSPFILERPRCGAGTAKSDTRSDPYNSDESKDNRARRVQNTRSSARLSASRKQINQNVGDELPRGHQQSRLDVDNRDSERASEGADGEDSDLSDPPSSDEDMDDTDSDEDLDDTDSDEDDTNFDEDEDDTNSNSGSERTNPEDSDFLSDPLSSDEDEDEDEQDPWLATHKFQSTVKRSLVCRKDAYVSPALSGTTIRNAAHASGIRHDIRTRNTKDGTKAYTYRKGILGAPPVDTDLPYELMSEVTDYELLAFFPNHAVHWPAITGRLMADGWTYSSISNYINKLRNPSGNKASMVVRANTLLHSIRNGCKQFTGDEFWEPKTPETRRACPIVIYSTTKWGPLERQRYMVMLQPAWTLKQIGEGLSRLSGGIPNIGKFSGLVRSALSDSRQFSETVSDRQRQSFNPPRLPPGWQPSTQALPLVPVSKRKVSHVASDKQNSHNRAPAQPRELPSRRLFHDRQTLPVSIRDDPDAIINHHPDAARGETLLWLLSRNGGCKQVIDIAKQKYAMAKVAAISREMVVSEPNIRSTLSHRKKSALTARAEYKGTSYEEEYSQFEEEHYNPALSNPRKLRNDTRRAKPGTDHPQEDQHYRREDVITYENSQYTPSGAPELQNPSNALQQDIPIDPMLLLPTTFATLSPQLTTWPEYLPARYEAGWSQIQPTVLPSVGTDITLLRQPDNFNELMDGFSGAWMGNEWEDSMS